jgi:hypothetical protein
VRLRTKGRQTKHQKLQSEFLFPPNPYPMLTRRDKTS